MSKGIPALTYLPKTQISVASGDTFSIRTLKAGLNKVAQMQEEETPVGTFANVKCLMDNPYSTCIWDFVVASGTGTFATGTVTFATAIVGNTVTANGLLYTAVSGAPAEDEFNIDTGDDEAATSLAAQITADTRSGTLGDLTAVSASEVVTMTTDVSGIDGNLVTLISSGATVAVSGSGFLTGGVSVANFQLTFDSEAITEITTIGRPALTTRRLLDISIVDNEFTFTVRSAQAALNLVDKFEDAVAETGTGTTGDGAFTDLIAKGPTPYQQFIWDITKADGVYVLTPTATS